MTGRRWLRGPAGKALCLRNGLHLREKSVLAVERMHAFDVGEAGHRIGSESEVKSVELTRTWITQELDVWCM